jgi:MFS transporter, AAHS family, 4-hydroxybenzoate transporter
MCGMPLGAMIGGGVSAALLPGYDWQAVFMAGGALPLIAAAISMVLIATVDLYKM